MTKNFTEVELLEIISCADELITALEGTNEDLHRDNSTKMCETWDHLNDDLAPPSVVKAMAKEILRLKAREIELEKHATKGWDWAGELADARTEQEARAEAAEASHQSCTNELVDAVFKIDELKAKLAERSKQKPAGYGVKRFDNGQFGSWLKSENLAKGNDDYYVVPLYEHPAPAVSLVELVPDEMPDMPDDFGDTEWRGMCDGWNACRYTILRKIEEVNL